MRPTINLVREKNPKDVKRRRDFSFNDNNGWPLKYENYRPEASPRSNFLYRAFFYLRYFIWLLLTTNFENGNSIRNMRMTWCENYYILQFLSKQFNKDIRRTNKYNHKINKLSRSCILNFVLLELFALLALVPKYFKIWNFFI